MTVTQMRSPVTNKPIPNQYLIRVGHYEFFQSYDTVIARRDTRSGSVVLSEHWAHSRTTSKYRCLFLGEDTTLTNIKIAHGEYTVVPELSIDDNKGELE